MTKVQYTVSANVDTAPYKYDVMLKLRDLTRKQYDELKEYVAVNFKVALL